MKAKVEKKSKNQNLQTFRAQMTTVNINGLFDRNGCIDTAMGLINQPISPSNGWSGNKFKEAVHE